MLNALRRSSARRRAAESLALAIAARARAPEFFRDLAVPDTFNGRFDMVTLHGWLVLERLEGESARSVSQSLINALFESFEGALREQGAGDMGMGRRVKKIANAFYGRLGTYRDAPDLETLEQALLRNVYGEEEASRAMATRLAHYTLAVRARLESQSPATGNVDFGEIA